MTDAEIKDLREHIADRKRNYCSALLPAAAYFDYCQRLLAEIQRLKDENEELSARRVSIGNLCEGEGEP